MKPLGFAAALLVLVATATSSVAQPFFASTVVIAAVKLVFP